MRRPVRKPARGWTSRGWDALQTHRLGRCDDHRLLARATRAVRVRAGRDASLRRAAARTEDRADVRPTALLGVRDAGRARPTPMSAACSAAPERRMRRVRRHGLRGVRAMNPILGRQDNHSTAPPFRRAPEVGDGVRRNLHGVPPAMAYSPASPPVQVAGGDPDWWRTNCQSWRGGGRQPARWDAGHQTPRAEAEYARSRFGGATVGAGSHGGAGTVEPEGLRPSGGAGWRGMLRWDPRHSRLSCPAIAGP